MVILKRALVFSGGGSRGIYEIGAWQALEEAGMRFDAVYGTSIGAINAGLYAQGDLAKARSLWDGISMRAIVATQEEFSIDLDFSGKQDILPFLIDNVNHLRMDITPLQNRVRTGLDEGRVRASGLQLGVMTVSAPQLSPVPMRLKDMAPGSVGDWLIASASCYPIFQAKWIGRQAYIDGGYVDNLPIDMALEDGAEEIVAVDIHTEPTHPEYEGLPMLKTIRPLRKLGGFLDFKPPLLERMRRLGYCDGLKALGRLEGLRYAFLREDGLSRRREAHYFVQAVAHLQAESAQRRILHGRGAAEAPLMRAILKEAPGRALTEGEFWLRGLELCAECMGFRDDAIYRPSSLAGRLLRYVRELPEVPPLTEAGLAEARGSRAQIACIFRGLEGETPPKALMPRLLAMPEETAAALWLNSLEGVR